MGPGARHCCAETGASAFALNARKASGVRHHTTGRRWRRDYPTGTVVSGVVKVVVEVTPLEVVPKIVAIAVVAIVLVVEVTVVMVAEIVAIAVVVGTAKRQ